jgi:hypothetical protein
MCVLLKNSNGVEVDVLLWLFQRGNDGQASYAPGQAPGPPQTYAEHSIKERGAQ